MSQSVLWPTTREDDWLVDVTWHGHDAWDKGPDQDHVRTIAVQKSGVIMAVQAAIDECIRMHMPEPDEDGDVLEVITNVTVRRITIIGRKSDGET